MKPLIVVADGFDKQLFKDLSSFPNFEVFPKPKVTAEEMATLQPKMQGLVVRSATTVNAAFLDKTPQLKYVIRAGEGTDNIDLALCQQRNIKVANTPGANSLSAAELAIALMFTLLRKTAWAHQSMAAGDWEKSAFNGMELSHKTIGIVGFGRIGQLVAKRLQGFEPRILFYDPLCSKTDIPNARPAAGLQELFQTCDLITLHLPYMKTTHHLIGKDLLGQMKESAFLINASRGNIVVEDDLVEALNQKKIRGAALDVFSQEPLPKDSRLRSVPNLLLTPHIGASTDEAQFRVGEMVVHQIKEFFIHNNLLNEVLP